jgi:hypothetical protein|tara:strand:- start:34 stop:285 length:252 start_codon:yes stop_codon:yes gene_type:complete
MSSEQELKECKDNLNWLTSQNRHLVSRVQQLEGILNAVQKQSPEALSFLQEAQARQEMGEEIRVGEELTEEGEEEEDQTQEEE